MNTCDTCKWWGYYSSYEYPGDPSKSTRTFHNSCMNEKVSAGKKRKDSANEATGERIHTGPKFGCIHWESK